MRGDNDIPFNILDDISLSHQELLSYAATLALSQKVYEKRVDYAQLHLGEARRNIENAYLAARQSKYSGRELPAISEWFYDNRFLFIEQIKQIELNKSAQKLPHIKSGRFANVPRSFALAVELARYSAFHLSVSGIEEFLEAYQKETGLNSGELWVFVDMLKAALLCAVSELARRSVESVKMRLRAQRFCIRLGQQPLPEVLDEFRAVLSHPLFIEHVMALTREHANAASVTEAIDARLSVADLSAAKLVKQAHAAQAKNLLHIEGAVSSLRMLAKISFESIFEDVSVVHKCLCVDETYPLMDFDSREHYRRCITQIASSMNASEPAVARAAVRLAAASGEHVGRFLTGDKREDLLRVLGKLPIKVRFIAFCKRHMLLIYAGGAIISAVVSAALLCLPLFFLYPPIYGIIGFIISLIPVYSVAMSVNNRIFTLITKPDFLPKLEFKEGIPAEYATMVVVPALVLGADEGRELLEKMEVYYAANHQPNLYFTLLSDFKEAGGETAQGEEDTIERIVQAVEELNARSDAPVFFYAQRKRTPLPEKGRFGGWERKRGALLDFCSLLRGDSSAFAHVTEGLPQNVKYVITLDADTELQRDAVVHMVGAMAHPLSRPAVDEATNTVRHGHAIMQPRIGIDVVSAAQTRFSLVSSGSPGLDAYSGAASDVYQDGFGTGIYTGKGIFDLDVYMRVLKDAFPDNRILSHDLIEGSYLRCALLTDVVLMDGFPAKYLSWAKRQHRWIRGDWQLLPWLKRTVQTKQGSAKNPLPGLARFQIIDNLRRSLTIPLSFIVILLSQTAFYHSAIFWFISGILPLFIDGILDFALRIVTLMRGAGKGVTLRDVWLETRTAFEQAFYKFAFLPFETWMTLDAVGRTIGRLFTKKKMLEWVTAAEGEKGAREGNAQYWRRMKIAPLLAAILYVLSIVVTGSFSIIAFIVFAIWFFAPSIAYAISRPRVRKRSALDAKQRAYLEDVALKTWRFFEHFSEEKEYFWMSDNYQQSPKKGLAKRTSPTNIAFSMAVSICAYYFGFTTLSETMGRIDRCLAGIERAEKWKGHLYNWYDIVTLTPLEPRYISSVDSGNLACYLIVADAAVADMVSRPMAAFLQLGLPAVSREAQREVSLCIGDDIFNAVYALRHIEDTGDTLSSHKKRLEAYLNGYAGWAALLCDFPTGYVNRYSELTQALRDALRSVSVREYGKIYREVLELLPPIIEQAATAGDAEVLTWVRSMERALSEGYIACRRLAQRAGRISRRLLAAFNAMDFTALYDSEKELFSIGYDVRAGQLSETHYDLLASEARQTSFIAIAKGEAPGKHWFRLARPLAVAGEGRVLLSWGGTMFEYFMPLIILRAFDHTLMSETYQSALALQVAYTEPRMIPWGVSESGYYAFDLHMNYQYKAFGIPSLGMKSGLVRETVVSPYSAALALQVNPAAALADLMRFEKIGALGRYGFFEAVDYTPNRMQKGKRKRIVKSYMAHHQGMVLASILNALQDGRLQTLFHSATIVKATEMLLKEKVPPRSVVLSPGEKQPEEPAFAEEIRAARAYAHFTGYPEAHFLSNGSYTVMITQYGTGYSAYRGSLVTRFMGDCLRDAPGVHVYIRDVISGNVWSATLLPTCVRADREKAVFEPHKATFERAVDSVETIMEVCVSPENDMEVRSLEIRNTGDMPARLEICCAFSPALAPQRDFMAHPSFVELFIDTETDAANAAVYARRRGSELCCGIKACACETAELMTDRAAIFGRNVVGTPAWAMPRAQGDVARALGVQCGVTVPPGETRAVSFAVAAGKSRQAVAENLSGMTGEEDVRRLVHLAWTHAQVEMRYLKLKETEAALFQRIASRTVLPVPPCVAPAGPMSVGMLWKHGISGDDPIICLHAHDAERAETVRVMGKAMEYMRLKGINAQLAIIYDGGEQYLCPLRDRVEEAAQAAPTGRIIALSSAHVEAADIAAVDAASCLILSDEQTLLEQLKTEHPATAQQAFQPAGEPVHARLPRQIRAFDNGIGGYMSHGAEYSIDMAQGTPRPWCNLLVNERFGSIVSAAGGGYSWVNNSRTSRLTPFRNDPLFDIPGEGILVRNDRTGEVFGLASNLCASGAYRTTHGIGYTVFERHGGVVAQALCFTDCELPARATLLTLENRTGREDTYSVFCFAEPALGETRCGGIFSTCSDGEMRAYAAFGPAKEMVLALPGMQTEHTNSAFEFFGSPGENITPQAMKADVLSGRDGGGTTVMALQGRLSLAPGEKKEQLLLFACGDTTELGEVRERFSDVGNARVRLEQTKVYWAKLTGGIRVSTNDKSLDMLVNGWLSYQVYAARLFGRTGYYQSGGAFGFRDQLQDMLSLAYTDPQRLKTHILHCAERQFIEGDVLHWWHEPTVGVRTHITDDKLFLPYAACEYVRITGDESLWEEPARYLESRCIPEGKCDIYECFTVGETSEPLFSHCIRAIDSSMGLGEHGLPLMGGGDWNDGMNRVGEGGKGESVWLAFFLAETLRMLAPVCAARGETELAERYAQHREMLMNNVEQNAWDGGWYLRAFFDDGTPLGSASSPECRIDLLSQGWAAIAGAPRARQAFDAAMERLVLREEGIIRLLWPPFDKWEKDPGYIRNYLPGVRENGGQYTHAAVWFIIAAAKLNRRDDAISLLHMINPINHTRTQADALKYRGEPYVVAADVYDATGHNGRAGWTWYTGAAGWMLQAAVIHILGMRIEHGELSILPCVPDDFGAYTITYRRGEAQYLITVEVQPGYVGEAWLSLDGGKWTHHLPLNEAAGEHQIRACWNPPDGDILGT